MGKTVSPLRRNGLALLVSVCVFCVTFVTVLRLCDMQSGSDFLLHSVWAVNMSARQVAASFYNGSERLWHILLKLIFAVTRNMWTSAAIATALPNAAACFLVFRTLDASLPECCPRWLLALLTGFLFVVGPLHIPGGDYYVGSVNTWHNPTNIMVRPFAAAAFAMILRMYDRRRYGTDDPGTEAGAYSRDFRFGTLREELRRPVYTGAELVLYPLCILFSAYAKPSFLQFFAPAILIFLLIDVVRTRGRLLPFCVKLALAYIPAALIILMQFSSFFSEGVSAAAQTAQTAAQAVPEVAYEDGPTGLALYFIQSPYTAGELMSLILRQLVNILRMSAFPLFILCLSPRRFLRDSGGRLSFTGAAVGRGVALFLHETGKRASHGNMLWCQYLSAWFLWIAAMKQYILLLGEKSTAGRLARWGGTALLLWHLASGVAYAVLCIRLRAYYF